MQPSCEKKKKNQKAKPRRQICKHFWILIFSK